MEINWVTWALVGVWNTPPRRHMETQDKRRLKRRNQFMSMLLKTLATAVARRGLFDRNKIYELIFALVYTSSAHA